MRTINITWSTEDVLEQAKTHHGITLTEAQADEIVGMLLDKHDACIGINWDVISYTIDEYLEESK
jgi:hypothetical protein